MTQYDEDANRFVFGEDETVECKFCGKGGFEWEETDEGYVLVDHRGLVHRCQTKQANDNDFEAIRG